MNAMLMRWRERIAWPTKKAIRVAGIVSASATTRVDDALAHSTGRRFGTAVNRRADHPGRVLAGDHQDAEDAECELRDLHADEVRPRAG